MVLRLVLGIALATGSDGVTLRQQENRAGAAVEVADVAEVLLRSVRPAAPSEPTPEPAPAPTSDPERAET